ncbi:class I SAM-dependent methyltransferase [Pelagibaculum spongiae]|uniref:Methyltransferase type 11 domain-containing protein n=1 Tax=Pelagibaculum spongiae TaxID=2080658 RepID=A0A2V1GU88_9GAMM|nr:class I SAM-dependent methyltransferase [Pelagibaculum spongiae]PVZ69579.1 hypothetical protein DC094_09690 [Pelagibaculum spongiae]
METSTKADKTTQYLQWLNSPAGVHYLDLEHLYLSDHLLDSFGYYMVSVAFHQPEYLDCSPIRARFHHQLGLSPTKTANIIGDEHLPYQTESIDLVVLDHALDYTDNPQQLLREACRCLIPGGKLLIAGFNPFSFWRCWNITRKGFPGSKNMLSVSRLQDWLTLLNMRQLNLHWHLPFPPDHSDETSPVRDTMEQAILRFQPSFSGMYCVLAEKTAYPITPIKQKWRRRLPPLTVGGSQLGGLTRK